ncbi:hypothetical protein CHUAL_011358 [Chamberlinius hualienensis]
MIRLLSMYCAIPEAFVDPIKAVKRFRYGRQAFEFLQIIKNTDIGYVSITCASAIALSVVQYKSMDIDIEGHLTHSNNTLEQFCGSTFKTIVYWKMGSLFTTVLSEVYQRTTIPDIVKDVPFICSIFYIMFTSWNSLVQEKYIPETIFNLKWASWWISCLTLTIVRAGYEDREREVILPSKMLIWVLLLVGDIGFKLNPSFLPHFLTKEMKLAICTGIGLSSIFISWNSKVRGEWFDMATNINFTIQLMASIWRLQGILYKAEIGHVDYDPLYESYFLLLNELSLINFFSVW